MTVAMQNMTMAMPNIYLVMSMECNSMVSIAAFGHRDRGSNPGWFTVLNSNQKLSFHE